MHSFFVVVSAIVLRPPGSAVWPVLLASIVVALEVLWLKSRVASDQSTRITDTGIETISSRELLTIHWTDIEALLVYGKTLYVWSSGRELDIPVRWIALHKNTLIKYLRSKVSDAVF